VQGEDQAKEKDGQETVTETKVEVTNSELIVSLSADAELETLRKAWSIFNPKLEWVGPEKNRLLHVEIKTKLDIDMVKANINQTKGVIAVQHNYVRDVLEPKQIPTIQD
jgi:hypothetical protein